MNDAGMKSLRLSRLLASLRCQCAHRFMPVYVVTEELTHG